MHVCAGLPMLFTTNSLATNITWDVKQPINSSPTEGQLHGSEVGRSSYVTEMSAMRSVRLQLVTIRFSLSGATERLRNKDRWVLDDMT